MALKLWREEVVSDDSAADDEDEDEDEDSADSDDSVEAKASIGIT